jgi:hypothetical protein
MYTGGVGGEAVDVVRGEGKSRGQERGRSSYLAKLIERSVHN